MKDEEQSAQFSKEVKEALKQTENLLIGKNKAYGDAALNPVRIFSKADSLEQLKVRIDDKLSRLVRGNDAGEDVIADLIGYLVMMQIQLNRMRQTEARKHEATHDRDRMQPFENQDSIR